VHEMSVLWGGHVCLDVSSLKPFNGFQLYLVLDGLHIKVSGKFNFGPYQSSNVTLHKAQI
jgi:hypothetical protein